MRAAFAGEVSVVLILVAGLGVGTLFGLFGAGGSAFATPVLALIGVPGLAAVASPLPAILPSAFAGARRYLRSGKLDRRVALLAIAGGVPGTVIGALASTLIDGRWLLILSGAMLGLVGVRVLWRDPVGHEARAAARRSNRSLVLAASFGVGLLTGLLANGGGFLLVPLFIVVLGLTSSEAAGTSMVAVGVLTIPTLATHWALGHIDWPIAIVFALGAIPGSVGGARLAQRIPTARLRRAFGVVLVVFAAWFLSRQLL